MVSLFGESRKRPGVSRATTGSCLRRTGDFSKNGLAGPALFHPRRFLSSQRRKGLRMTRKISLAAKLFAAESVVVDNTSLLGRFHFGSGSGAANWPFFSRCSDVDKCQ